MFKKYLHGLCYQPRKIGYVADSEHGAFPSLYLIRGATEEP